MRIQEKPTRSPDGEPNTLPQLRIKRQRRRSGFGKLQREAARRRRTDRRLALASFLSLLGLLVLCYRLLVARGA